MRQVAVVVLFLLAGIVPSSAVDSIATVEGVDLPRLFPGARFADGIPSPEAALGVRTGARPVRHEELLAYFLRLAASTPRARWIEYARSWEGRPLGILAVSDEATIARLETFREEHVRRMDPRRGEAADLPAAKAVAWMAYGIHGDEVSSSDAAAAIAYWLVAGEDDLAKRMRRELVILIDPCENPDGRDRFLTMTRAFAHLKPNPDPSDLSHAAIWPQGRGNHFLFDLNRDWFTMVHPESRRSTVIASWIPQLLVDSHEMGPDDTYLFSPSRHPFNPFLPERHGAWQQAYAADQSRALDRRGYAYYTREWNEEFFPGYGSSWAAYLGTIGILYEMAGTDGTLVKQAVGTVRTFAQAVEHQVTSSVANLTTLLEKRPDALAHTFGARREAIRRGKEGPVRAWILSPGVDRARADALASRLRAQGIEVLRSATPVKAAGLRDARTGETIARELPAGAWLVAMDQPAGLLARVLLDPHVPMGAAFLAEEREYLERGRSTRLYDTTAWSLPLLHDVEAYWTATRPPGEWKDEAAPETTGRVDGGGEVVYGWLLDGTTDAGSFALADLLQRGLAARVAEKPFRVEGKDWPQGAVLVKREGNPEDLPSRLREVAARWKVEIRGTATAKSETGPDLGGGHFHPLVAPRLGVFTGPQISSSAYGFLWHLLDAEADLRFTALDLSSFEWIDLARFNVLVFPPAGGSAESYRTKLGKEGIARLRAWIEAGGTAIGVGGGSEFLADKDVALAATRPRSQALDRWPPVVWGLSAKEAESAGPFRAVGLDTPPPAKSDAAGGKTPPAQPAPARGSPYDIAPVLGAGARPFAEGTQIGTPVTGDPVGLAEWLKPLLPTGTDKPREEDLRRADARLRRFAPSGAILRIDLDPEMWLDWGLPRELAAWVGGGDVLVAEPPVQVAARFADLGRLHLGGLLWPEAAARIARTAYATREAVGRGQIVLFAGHPVFRGWTLGTRRLFLNALLYGPGLGTRWSSPW